MKKTLLTLIAGLMAITPALANKNMDEPCPPIRTEWYGPSITGFMIKYVDMYECDAESPHQRYLYFQTGPNTFTKHPCIYGLDKDGDDEFGKGEIYLDTPQCDGWNGNEREPGE